MNRQPRYSKEEHARRDEEIYEHHLRAQLEPGNRGKVVAIDIDTWEYEVADEVISAGEPLLVPIAGCSDLVCPHRSHRGVPIQACAFLLLLAKTERREV